MSQIIREKSKLPCRVRRVRGQVAALEWMLGAERTQGANELIDALCAYIE